MLLWNSNVEPGATLKDAEVAETGTYPDNSNCALSRVSWHHCGLSGVVAGVMIDGIWKGALRCCNGSRECSRACICAFCSFVVSGFGAVSTCNAPSLEHDVSNFQQYSN